MLLPLNLFASIITEQTSNYIENNNVLSIANQELDKNFTDFFVVNYSDKSAYFFSETPFIYHSSNSIKTSDGARLDVFELTNDLNGDVLFEFVGTNSAYALGDNTIFYSRNDILDESGNVFFSPPKMIISEMANPQTLPQMIMKTLVDGGILSLALVILGIWLAVGLVKRLAYLFLRST